VIDQEYEDCSNWTAIDPIDCEGGVGDCEIGELIIDDHPCEEGMFWVYFNFEYGNTSEVFHVYANDSYFGAFEYAELPLNLGPLEGDGETVYYFHVIDSEDPSCHSWKVFGPIECESGGDCLIGELNVDFIECDEEGYYWVGMNFEYEYVSEEGFKFFLNDELFGVYDYDDLPIEIGPLAGDGETQYDFYVRDEVYEDCSNWKLIGPEECENWGGGECNIWDVIAEPQPCDGNLFNVLLDFEFENVGDNGFKVVGNGNNYGTYDYESLPISIGPLAGDGVTIYEFVAKDLSYEGCSDWTAIDPIYCGEVGVYEISKNAMIQLYPNPASDVLNIVIGKNVKDGFLMIVYDSFGKEINYFEDVKKSNLQLEINNYPKGTYFVKIQYAAEESIIGSFIKQ